MKVMKFGGTSVGTTERMKGVVALIKREQQKSGNSEQGTTPVVVVLSAMSGTTNSLVEISNYLYKKNADGANEIINSLENKYLKHIDDLFSTDDTKTKCGSSYKRIWIICVRLLKIFSLVSRKRALLPKVRY